MNITSEYIERKALLKKAKELAGGSFSTPLIISAIENAPKADVVEVVRCKNCEHKKEIPNCQKELYSSSCVACSYHSGLIMDGNDFCSYGVRKEGAEE